VETKTKSILRIHLGLIFGEILCISAFLFEISRALGGNELSWAYVVEWPLLAVYCVHMWRRLLQDERGIPRKSSAKNSLSQEPDPELDAWNEYLAKVHGQDAQAEAKRED